uniref:Uncharacterized protein n=1 Tax=viral metagenome TaxID=1070528 RepID=A0A6C0BKG6_9ZZZZ
MNKQLMIEDIKNSAYVYNSQSQVGYQRIASTLSDDGRFILSFIVRYVLEHYEKDNGSIVLSLGEIGDFMGISPIVRAQISELSSIVDLRITSRYEPLCKNMVFNIIIQPDAQGIMRSVLDAAERVYGELDGVANNNIIIENGRVLNPESLMSFGNRPRDRSVDGLEELSDQHLTLINSQVNLRSELLKALSDPSHHVEGFELDPSFHEDIKNTVVTIHQYTRGFNVMFSCKDDMDQFLEKYSNTYKILSMEEVKPYGIINCEGEVRSALSSELTIFTRGIELIFSCPPRSHMDTAIATAAVASDLFILF